MTKLEMVRVTKNLAWDHYVRAMRRNDKKAMNFFQKVHRDLSEKSFDSFIQFLRDKGYRPLIN